VRVRPGKLKTSDNREGVVLQYAHRVIGSPALASVPAGGSGMFHRSVREDQAVRLCSPIDWFDTPCYTARAF